MKTAIAIIKLLIFISILPACIILDWISEIISGVATTIEKWIRGLI